MTNEMHTITATDFDTIYDAEHTFPFFEDENANGVYGYGHTDKAEFAKGVNEYDTLCNFGSVEDQYTANDVAHQFAVIVWHEPSGDWALQFAEADVEGVYAITTVSR